MRDGELRHCGEPLSPGAQTWCEQHRRQYATTMGVL
jgi:hypothetical protein